MVNPKEDFSKDKHRNELENRKSRESEQKMYHKN